MDTEQAQEQKQDPRDGVIDATVSIATIGLVCHLGNQKQINDPSDQEQSTGKEPQNSGQRFTEIEPMETGKSKSPQQIANQEEGMSRCW